MKNILFALPDNYFPATAFSFLKKINEHEAVSITGLSIPDPDYDLQLSDPGNAGFYMRRLIEEDDAMVMGNITTFKEECTTNHIRHRIHSDLGESVLKGISKETRFSDLFVIEPDRYYQSGVAGIERLQQIIENAECPVLLIPATAMFPENTVIAYDGSEDSLYALKMFTYLLPPITGHHTLIVYSDSHATDIPEESRIKDLVKDYFSQADFSILRFNPKKHFVNWIEERPKTLLVAGAYGRSELSRLFKRSFIEDLLDKHSIPIFIAHK